MLLLTTIEKEIICRLFEISDGYVFKSWCEMDLYAKTTTKDLVLEACGINIEEDPEYIHLTQEECIKKILNGKSPHDIANVLELFSKYLCHLEHPSLWSYGQKDDDAEVYQIIERLRKLPTIDFPSEDNSLTTSLILNDIQDNLQKQTPELAIDRLHTLTTKYIRIVCKQHQIPLINNKDQNLSLHSLVGSLSKFYENNNYINSDFSLSAIKHSISLFEKFNAIRNNHSAAHVNPLLSKVEAEYVIRIVSDTISFIDHIEHRDSSDALIENKQIYENIEDLPF